MQKSYYAIAGVVIVAIIGGLLAFCGLAPQKTQSPQQPPAQSSTTPPKTPETKTVATDSAVKPEPEAQPPVAQAPATAQTQTTAPLNQNVTVTVPVFDVLRLEGDGSLVIAGKAAPNSTVDVISRTRVLGSAMAGENGDFAIILDEALKSGDHQLVLRATSDNNAVATSQQTAILSVPEKPDGQVLALVAEPGQASRMLTMPQAGALVAADPHSTNITPTHMTPAQSSQSEQAAVAPLQNPAPTGAQSDVARAAQKIAVEAVEIDGRTVFVAGTATGGQSVTVHANDILLGATVITPAGRFLIQSQQPLPVGDYIIRADLLDQAGKVLTTARVPFRREAGDNVAAVAPKLTTPAQPQSAGEAEQQVASDPQQDQALEKADGSVIIRKGDNLWTISKRTYGDGLRYTTIYLANRDQIKNPDLIWPGQVFVMPEKPLGNDSARPAQ